jgi:hypothetical protein
MAWQPIETAPEDEDVLLCTPDTGPSSTSIRSSRWLSDSKSTGSGIQTLHKTRSRNIACTTRRTGCHFPRRPVRPTMMPLDMLFLRC